MSDLYTFTPEQESSIEAVETLLTLRRVRHGFRDASVQRVVDQAMHTVAESFP